MHSFIVSDTNRCTQNAVFLGLRLSLAVLLLVPIVTFAARAPTNYTYYLTGNAADVVKPTTAGSMLMGGGADVDDAFRWMITKSGGGDFVVLRATGTNGYNKYIKGLGALDSVETIVTKNRAAASDPFVVDKILHAEALFIAGGDQADYVNYWKGTPLEDAIHSLVQRNVPIGGTSAGLAVLGDYSFSALTNTVYSADALANPYHPDITLERDFLHLPLLANIITDSHFVARDRIGRLVVFLARIFQNGWSTGAKGIGVDEQTAVLVDANGSVSLKGIGKAYFLSTAGMPEVCTASTPLTYRNLSVYRLRSGGTFNIGTWTGSGGTAYMLSAENGVLTSTQAGNVAY